MSPLRRILTAGVFVFALTAAAGSQQHANPDLARFRSDLEQLRQTLLVPGLSAAIVQDGKIFWAGGLGYRDEAARLPATENTRYPIASLTKCFTAVAAMQLVGRKRLNLDDPANKYGDRSTGRMRVRHYLSQMSEAEPGVRFLYNSERFNRLGAILEKGSGQPLKTLFEQQIFRPAGMADTTAGFPDTPDARNELAAPYDVSPTGRAVKDQLRPSPVEAASGIVSTVLDLAKFDIALDDNKLLKPALKFEMWTPSLSQLGPTPYGLGWFVENYKGDDLVWHYGQLPGYSALFLKIPQKHLTLIPGQQFHPEQPVPAAVRASFVFAFRVSFPARFYFRRRGRAQLERRARCLECAADRAGKIHARILLRVRTRFRSFHRGLARRKGARGDPVSPCPASISGLALARQRLGVSPRVREIG